ncbi:hypothetical protein SUGI_0855700 [Cryptomeria japonica]|nr:hypothetical protein SUGI_0855700 [Cryptomeria japonica]
MEEKWGLDSSTQCCIVSKKTQRKDVKWKAPSAKWCKLNFDRASKGDLAKAGFGAILRDEKGMLVKVVMGFMGITLNNKEEVCGLSKGLEVSVKYGVSRVIIEGDSQFILNGECK